MKIALFGTHGTGKTTLGYDLVAKLKKQGADVNFLSEIARKCPFPLNENATKKSQIWIILSQIIAEFESEEGVNILICDRSVLDGYCYYVNKFGRFPALEALVREHLKTYSKLIRVPIREGFLKKDNVRSINVKFQKDVDEQFDKFIKLFGLDKRVQQIKKGKPSDEEIVDKILNLL